MNTTTLTLENCLRTLKPRDSKAHKGNFGHVLVVGGDYGFFGAARLAGEAALRSGAGLVSIATRKENAYAISGNCPELMCHGIEEAKDLAPLLQKVTVVLIGPGLGTKDWGKDLFTKVLQSALPLVVDADGLNLLASTPTRRHNWVLTPHPGEAATLLKSAISNQQHERVNEILQQESTNEKRHQDRVHTIQTLQQHFQGVVILKGANTLILGQKDHSQSNDDLSLNDNHLSHRASQPHGNTALFLCDTENPTLATAGTGDVLSGIIAALIAQHLSLLDAAKLGVIVHARAAEIERTKGERGMKASDLFLSIRRCLNP